MAADWRGPINGLLYGLIFTPEITDETVTDCADAALNYTVLGSSPKVYYEAIQKALSSGERLDGLGQLPQFDQTQIAEFLRALADRLDALRPWPEPKFLRLQASTWAAFADAVPIARIDTSILRIRNIVRGVFEPAGDDQPGRYVLMLKLATGETVALLGSHGAGEKVTLLADPADDPATVIEHLTAATGFPQDKVLRIWANRRPYEGRARR